MSSSLLEIVELDDGEFVLRRAEDDAPLLSIRFSEESIHHLNEGRLEIVKAMIEAGIETAGDLAQRNNDDADSDVKVVH